MSSSPRASEDSAESRVAEAFRSAGWIVKSQPRPDNLRAYLLVRRGKERYAIDIERAPEGRSDRVVPLLAQAILQAQAASRSVQKASPLAVVVIPRVQRALVDRIRSFAKEYAPGVALGVVGLDGFRAFFGPGLEALDARPRQPVRAPSAKLRSQVNLFSDLNQWMLKVLIAPQLPEEMLSAPRREISNASALASAAGVSVMSAFRLVRQLSAEGFIDDAGGALHLVRVQDLLQRWRSAKQDAAPELPMRWILRAKAERQLERALSAASNRGAPEARGGVKAGPFPRACLGLFAAANALGLGFVHGVKPHLYLEELSEDAFRRLGLMHAEAGDPVDLLVRVPSAPESVFRGMVIRKGVPVSDVLQVWLDVSFHPARGQAQAAEIARRVLAPLFRKK